MNSTNENINIVAIPAFQDNYIWVMINAQKQAIVVDPGEAEQVLAFIKQEQLQLVAIWLTHHHYDHTNGVAEILENYEVPVFGPTLDSIPSVTHQLKEKDIVSLPNFQEFIIFDIPGHTKGHIAFYGNKSLFCGDTLFAGGCGRLFEGTAEQMFLSLLKIRALPDDTKIYCAHEYTANNLRFAKTIETNNLDLDERIKQVADLVNKGLITLPSILAEEKKTNPFLRCHIPDVFLTVEKMSNQSLSSFVNVFKCLRASKDQFK